MQLFFGLFLFLLGIEGSKRGLERLANTKIRAVITKFTGNFYFNLLIGIIFTGILQSSSAMSIIVISMVEANLIKFKPALGIVLGANIGTTITVQILSFPILSIYPYLIFIGLTLMIIQFIEFKNSANWGLVFLSFGIIFGGLFMMTEYFKAPENSKFIFEVLAFCGKNKVYGILAGMFTTAIIQSSSSITAITISMAKFNLITLPVAISISLGSNVGTCITAFLASINSNQTSKSIALGHFLFNITGVIILSPFLDLYTRFISLTSPNLPRQIANAHTIFNIINVIIFLPFLNTFISFLRRNINWKS